MDCWAGICTGGGLTFELSMFWRSYIKSIPWIDLSLRIIVVYLTRNSTGYKQASVIIYLLQPKLFDMKIDSISRQAKFNVFFACIEQVKENDK